MLRVLPLIALLLVSACSRGQTAAASQDTPAATAGQDGAAPAAAEIKPVPAQLPDLIARVNGEAIDKAEFEKAVQTIESQNGGPVPPDQRDRVLRGILDQIIGYKLLVQESQARKVTVADAEVEARLNQVRAQFPTEEAFTQALAQQNVTVDQLRADARSEMLVTKMLEAEIEPKAAVTPADLQDFYTKNPDQFKQNERVRASHILIGFPQDADAAAKQAAKTKAEGILKEVKAGKDFAELAKANSSDPGSAQQGGDLNFFERGQMVGPFDQAVFSLAPGQTSELVETQFGYHIIKVTDKQAERTMPLDEVRPQLTEFLQNQKRQTATQAFVDSLKTKGKIEIFI
ncbi:MAG: peptidylprolyl isomerase [Vicinamibacterales bacterium]